MDFVKNIAYGLNVTLSVSTFLAKSKIPYFSSWY